MTRSSTAAAADMAVADGNHLPAAAAGAAQAAAAEGGRAAPSEATDAAVAAEPSNYPSKIQAGDTQARGMQWASQRLAEPETGEQTSVEMTVSARPAAKQVHSESQATDTDDVQMAGPDSPAARQAEPEHEAGEQADTEMTAADRPTACKQLPRRRLETHVWHAKRMKMVHR